MILDDIKLKQPRLTERIACAVEAEFKEAVQAYAEHEGVSESQAARFLMALGLQSEFKKTKSQPKKS